MLNKSKYWVRKFWHVTQWIRASYFMICIAYYIVFKPQLVLFWNVKWVRGLILTLQMKYSDEFHYKTFCWQLLNSNEAWIRCNSVIKEAWQWINLFVHWTTNIFVLINRFNVNFQKSISLINEGIKKLWLLRMIIRGRRGNVADVQYLDLERMRTSL